MPLDPSLYAALKADILANTDPVVVQALADGNTGAIVDWYNADATPDYYVFRASVTADEIRKVIDVQDLADVTDTDRGRVVDILAIRQSFGFSGENARDRSAFDDVFSAAQGDNSQQAIAALWQRLATRAEQLFSLSTGAGSLADPDTTPFQGDLTVGDVSNALAS